MTFTGWYGHRNNGNQNADPPGYRKHNDEHPRSTVTFKEAGFKHDATNGRIRLSKGRNLKEHRSDFIPPERAVENVQQVRAVHEHGVWRLHIVCRVEIGVSESPGNAVAGIDLGICNVAAVSFGDESLLYPGGALKADEYYFAKKRAETDDSASRETRRLDQKRTDRRTHFLHTLSKDIVAECVERGAGTIVVGDLAGIREDGDTGDPTNWGDHGNLDLHGWTFDRFETMLEYKGEERGIDVVRTDERGTSKSCSACGRADGPQRVERGLYVCESCGLVANADSSGAENIRQKVLPNLATDGGRDRDNGWLASRKSKISEDSSKMPKAFLRQPAVHSFDRSEGGFAPREQESNREP